MATDFSHDGARLQLPESGPVALSLSDMLRFQALRAAYPADERYHWNTNRPLAELSGNLCHGAADLLLMLHYEGTRPVAGLEAIRDRILFDGQPYEWMWLGNQLTLPEPDVSTLNLQDTELSEQIHALADLVRISWPPEERPAELGLITVMAQQVERFSQLNQTIDHENSRATARLIGSSATQTATAWNSIAWACVIAPGEHVWTMSRRAHLMCTG